MGRPYLSVLARVFGYLIFSILFLPGIVLAGATEFFLDNSYVRQQESVVNDWVVTETFGQDYSFDWEETFSNRLDVNLEFELKIEDIFKSNDVDTKELTPSIQLDLSSVFWDLAYTAEDTIEYTNEFNKKRKDNLEFSADLSLVPEYLPPIDVTIQTLLNEQEGLEDTREERFDFITTYSFGSALTMNASINNEELDDRLIDNSDKSRDRWDFSAAYNQLITPAIKFNIDTTWDSSTEDTLNNIGQVISTDRSRSVNNRAKLSMATWPQINTDLEITNEKELVDDTDSTIVSFSFDTSQDILTVGNLTESIGIERERLKSPIPQDDVRELNFDFSLVFSGSPSKYLDYSIEQSLSFGDSEFADTSLNSDSRTNAFDLSLTMTPLESLSVDTAYNRSSEYTLGSIIDQSRSFKFELTYEDDVFDIPNLIFRPSIGFSSDFDRVEDEVSDSQTFDLLLTYTFNLPSAFVLVLEPSYSYEKSDGVTKNIEIGLNYEVALTIGLADWEFSIENDGEYTNNSDEEDEFDNDFQARFSVGLLGNIQFDIEYQYQFIKGSDNADSLEASLDMDFDKSNLSFSYVNDRTFLAEKDVLRTFEAVFAMDF